MAVLFAALMAVTLLPFALSSPLPLMDLPNHIARTYLLHALDGDHPLAALYRIDWHFLPNLAVDLIVPPLLPLLSPHAAMALFVAATLVLQASGVVVVHRMLFGRWSLFPTLVFFVLYNRILLWGFVNYLFALGLAFWMFAAWLWLRERPTPVRLPLFAVLVLALAPMHLYGVAFLALLVGGYEISQAVAAWRTPVRTVRRLSLDALPFVPALALITASRTTSEGALIWGTFSDKVVGLLQPFNNYVLPLDIATLILFGLLALAGLVTGRVIVHRFMVLPLVLGGLAYLALPTNVFAADSVDFRFVPALAMLAIASCDWRVRSGRHRLALTGALFCLFAARIAVVAVAWAGSGAFFDEVREATAVLNPADKVAVTVAAPAYPNLPNLPVIHAAALAVNERQAFVNALFHRRGHQVLTVTLDGVPERYQGCCSNVHRLDTARSDAPVLSYDPLAAMPIDAFDYVFVFGPQFFPQPFPAALEPVAAGTEFVLFRVTAQDGDSTAQR